MLSWFSANLSTIVISLTCCYLSHCSPFDSPAKAGKALLRWQLRCLRRLQKLPQQTLNSENCEGRHPRSFSFPAKLALSVQEC